MKRVQWRLRSTRYAYVTARRFGRCVVVSAWVSVRMLLSGRTGKYRIKN